MEDLDILIDQDINPKEDVTSKQYQWKMLKNYSKEKLFLIQQNIKIKVKDRKLQLKKLLEKDLNEQQIFDQLNGLFNNKKINYNSEKQILDKQMENQENTWEIQKQKAYKLQKIINQKIKEKFKCQDPVKEEIFKQKYFSDLKNVSTFLDAKEFIQVLNPFGDYQDTIVEKMKKTVQQEEKKLLFEKKSKNFDDENNNNNNNLNNGSLQAKSSTDFAFNPKKQLENDFSKGQNLNYLNQNNDFLHAPRRLSWEQSQDSDLDNQNFLKKEISKSVGQKEKKGNLEEQKRYFNFENLKKLVLSRKQKKIMENIEKQRAERNYQMGQTLMQINQKDFEAQKLQEYTLNEEFQNQYTFYSILDEYLVKKDNEFKQKKLKLKEESNNQNLKQIKTIYNIEQNNNESEQDNFTFSTYKFQKNPFLQNNNIINEINKKDYHSTGRLSSEKLSQNIGEIFKLEKYYKKLTKQCMVELIQGVLQIYEEKKRNNKIFQKEIERQKFENKNETLERQNQNRIYKENMFSKQNLQLNQIQQKSQDNLNPNNFINETKNTQISPEYQIKQLKTNFSENFFKNKLSFNYLQIKDYQNDYQNDYQQKNTISTEFSMINNQQTRSTNFLKKDSFLRNKESDISNYFSINNKKSKFPLNSAQKNENNITKFEVIRQPIQQQNEYFKQKNTFFEEKINDNQKIIKQDILDPYKSKNKQVLNFNQSQRIQTENNLQTKKITNFNKINKNGNFDPLSPRLFTLKRPQLDFQKKNKVNQIIYNENKLKIISNVKEIIRKTEKMYKDGKQSYNQLENLKKDKQISFKKLEKYQNNEISSINELEYKDIQVTKKKKHIHITFEQ